MTPVTQRAVAIDRLAAARRPAQRVVMRQRWTDLLFLHWRFAAGDVRPLVPPALEVDTFEGDAFVSLVGFAISGVRPPFLPPVPVLSSFNGVNVRTYVHRRGRDPGVWFLSLDASSALAVQAARLFFKLPCTTAHIRLRPCEAGPGIAGRLELACERGSSPAACTVRYGPAGPAAPAEPDTLEHFLLERYMLYSADKRHLYRARIHHLPFAVQAAEVSDLRETLLAAAGLPAPSAAPLAHYVAEAGVEMFAPQRLRKRSRVPARPRSENRRPRRER